MLESKRRAIIFLSLAFLLAVSAGYLFYEKVKDLNSDLGGRTKVYIAASDIPSRSLIQDNHIATMEIPNRFVTESHVTAKEDLVNKVLVLPLAEGDLITRNMIKPVSNLRNEDNRLVALYRSEKVQFDQVIEALDRVDIIVSQEKDGTPTTEVFMKDVPVSWAQGTGKDFTGVAVEVSSEQAPKLIHIQNYADKIRVLKANVGNEQAVIQEETVKNTEEKPAKEVNANAKEPEKSTE
jgi:Flp pilus assembly protein CpaB